MFFLYFAVRYAVNEKQLAFVGVGLVLINNYQPAASLAAVGVVACTVSLNKLDSVNVHRKCVFMVMAEECGDDIARFFPALKLGSYFIGRAWTLAERAVKNSAFFGNVKLAVSFDSARSALADLGQFVVFLQNRDMLEKQRRNGFSTVSALSSAAFFSYHAI